MFVIYGLEGNGYRMYNEWPFLAIDRVAVAYPISIEIYRDGNVGDDTEILEVQWIIEH
jgi:hypothetical protein